MQYKRLSLLALAGLAAAQNSNGTQSLTEVLSSSPNLSNLTSLVTANPQLAAALSSAQNITILAPTNQAFSAILNSDAAKNADLVAALLQYHVLNGTFLASSITNTSAFVPTLLTNKEYTNVTGGQVVQGVVSGNNVVFFSGLLKNSTVTKADVKFTGGVIHIIDTVLTLPAPVTQTALAANLTALYGAVNATGLIPTVNETPDLTIFAPTNQAFQEIASALANATTKDITSVLAYHVVNGTVGYSSGLKNGTELQTLNGGKVKITIDKKGGVWVNNAKVVGPNVLVANGVVHVIDQVLNPANTSGPSGTATSGSPAFTGASSASNVPFTSGQPKPTTTVNVPAGGPAQTTKAASGSPTGAAVPMQTGAMGAAALFGAAAAVVAAF